MPDIEITLNKMSIEDCPKVYGIERICFPSTSWRQEDFEAAIDAPDQCYIVAKVANTLVGFVALYIMQDCGDIVNIAVHPAWQKKGIGNALLCTLLKLETVKGLSHITLEVRKSNRRAIALYEAYDFRQIGVREGYYANPTEDACIMQRKSR